jgi:nitroreductase
MNEEECLVEVLEAIRTRRSIRKYKDQDVADDLIDQILTAGTWAPSGMDNQPWRFAVIRDKKLKSDIAKLAEQTKMLENAPVIIPVFFDHNAGYDNTKDIQTMGACLQNMLLAIHGLGLGGLWLGEIRKNMDKVRVLCGAPEKYELMAVIVLGYSAQKAVKGKRKDLEDVVFLRK